MTPSGETPMGKATLILLGNWIVGSRKGMEAKIKIAKCVLGFGGIGLGAGGGVSVSSPPPWTPQWVPLEGEAESINRQRTYFPLAVSLQESNPPRRCPPSMKTSLGSEIRGEGGESWRSFVSFIKKELLDFYAQLPLCVQQ